MQDTATKSESVANQLKDKKLFREACYIDGSWVQSKSGGAVQVDNPATGEIIGSVPKLGVVETREAIEAANRAFLAWSKKTGKERAAVKLEETVLLGEPVVQPDRRGVVALVRQSVGGGHLFQVGGHERVGAVGRQRRDAVNKLG